MASTFRAAEVRKPLVMGLWTPPSVSRHPRESRDGGERGSSLTRFPGNGQVVDPAHAADVPVHHPMPIASGLRSRGGYGPKPLS
jgi:hypothetical protein